MEKYIGPKKVVSVIDFGKDDNASSVDMVQVNLEDDSKELMPKLRYEIISTVEPSDLSKIQTTMTNTVGAMVFAVLNAYGVKMSEVSNILNYAEEQVNSNYRKSRDLLFGVDHEDLMINNINSIIENYAKIDSDNGAAPAGGESN